MCYRAEIQARVDILACLQPTTRDSIRSILLLHHAACVPDDYARQQRQLERLSE
jgi:hypothetical protein